MTSRARQVAVWVALGASLAAALLFVVVRGTLPSDGARVAFYDEGWSATGVEISPIDAPSSGLQAGDTVTSIAGRPLEAWVQYVLDGAVDRSSAGTPIPYELLRNGEKLAVDVTWTPPSIGATLLGGWGVIVFSVVFAAIAALVFAQRPTEPAALPLVLAASAAAGSSLPWFLGVTTSDIVQGTPFALHALLTGALYMLMWPAVLHIALVFPTRLPIVHRHPWLIWLVYLVSLGGYALALLVVWIARESTLDWIGRLPVVQVAFIVPLLSFALALLVRSYVRTRDPAARTRMRWATLGGAGSAIVGLGVFWLPQLVLGRQLVDASWLGVAALPFPLGLAAGILRDRLFDIDVVINRTLVYGGLTLAVIASYAVAASALGNVVGPEHGYGVSLVASGIAAVIALPLRDILQRGVNRLMYGERDEPWRVLRRLGQRLEWTAEPDRAFPAIAQTIADALRLPYVALELVGHDGDRAIVAAHGVSREPTTSIPLVHGGETIGQLTLGVRPGDQGFRPDELGLLEDLARQASAAVHAIRLRDELARSREELVLAREEERRRLRRDLHDGLGPSLAAIGLRAEASATTLATDPAGATLLLDELGADVRIALADIRRLVEGLRPPALDEIGLVGAIEQQMTRLQSSGGSDVRTPSLAIESDPFPLPALPAAVEVAAYRIAVEGVTNAIRHADAGACHVRLEVRDGLSIEITDDGRGMPAEPVPGVGLESIRVRAEELGGSWRIEHPSTGGTRIAARLPLTATRAGAP